MNRVRYFFSKEAEPLRRRIYGVAGPLLLALATQGLITADMANVLIAVIGTFLIVPATEWARTKVTPAAKTQARIVRVIVDEAQERRGKHRATEVTA